MDHESLLQVIHEDPYDDGLRLAFADCLEANHQPDRAEWIRASCAIAGMRYDDEGREQALQREMAAFSRCRPPWWESLSNINQKNDRGMFRFILGESRSSRGAAPVKRLNKVAWLGKAFADGWLLRVELMWDDGELAPLVARWREPASQIPLHIRPAPQIGDDGLRQLLRLPQLQGLELEAHVLRNQSARELSQLAGVVELTVEFRLVDNATVDAMLAQIVSMIGLKRLHLKGHESIQHGTRPNDADLFLLRTSTNLKRLFLSASPAVTDGGIAELRRKLPNLLIDRENA
jgi:uncharacterized protein (TIGR02996 family)